MPILRITIPEMHHNTVSSDSVFCKNIKGKAVRAPPERRRGAHLPVKAVEPVGGWTTESVTHGQCDARPTVTFPAAERRRPLAGTKLYCLVTEAHGCKQLAQSCYSVADWPGFELATFRSRANALTTEPPSHPKMLKCTTDLNIHSCSIE